MNMKLVFYVWAWTFFFLFRCDLHLLKVLDTKCYSPHYVCIMWKEMIEKINGPIEESFTIFLNVFLMFKKIWLQNYFDICFDNLIKYITSLLYSACSMISTHLYLYNNFFNDMNIHFSKKKQKT
jgi:hypothetical protein